MDKPATPHPHLTVTLHPKTSGWASWLGEWGEHGWEGWGRRPQGGASWPGVMKDAENSPAEVKAGKWALPGQEGGHAFWAAPGA